MLGNAVLKQNGRLNQLRVNFVVILLFERCRFKDFVRVHALQKQELEVKMEVGKEE